MEDLSGGGFEEENILYVVFVAKAGKLMLHKPTAASTQSRNLLWRPSNVW